MGIMLNHHVVACDWPAGCHWYATVSASMLGEGEATTAAVVAHMDESDSLATRNPDAFGGRRWTWTFYRYQHSGWPAGHGAGTAAFCPEHSNQAAAEVAARTVGGVPAPTAVSEWVYP